MDKPWNWALFGTHILSTVTTDVPLSFYLDNGRKALAGELGSVHPGFAKFHKKGFHLHHCNVAHNTKVTINHLVQYNGSRKDWYDFGQNPNFTLQNVLDHRDKFWNWQMISCHPNVTFDDIQNHPDLPWDWQAVSANINISIAHIMAFPEQEWDWQNLSQNRNISVDDIMQTKDSLPWKWEYVSLNPTLTLEHIVRNQSLPWCWKALVRHPSITFKDIIAHDHLPWGSSGLYTVRYDINHNPNITLEDIRAHRRLACKGPEYETYAEWHACFMWEKKNFNIDWILMFPETLKWYPYPVSKHPGITWEDVKKHSKLPWCHKGLSANPNVPLKSILARKNLSWDWQVICERADFLDPLDVAEARRYFALKKICSQLYESYTNPTYKMCRTRLMKEFRCL
jgi:hypothetical protein